jgi:hypothetical protein
LGPGTFYCSGVIEQIFPASLKEIHVTNQFWYDGQYVAGSSLQSFTIKANFFYPCFIRSGWKMPYYWDGTGRGRMYVKNEALRQQYISDATWSLLFNPGSATLSDMILVDPTN